MSKKQSKTSTGTFEHSIKRLEKIVETLEEGSVPLEEALKMYEEGVMLSKLCLEKLKHAELKLKTLSKDVNGNFELFEQEEQR
jgi:exodeoxyribonuclease VII small subunit